MTKGLMAGLAAATTVAGLAAIPTAASAQSYYNPGYGNYYGGGYNYDPCQRDTTQRGTTGGLVGAAIGAAVGRGIAAHGVRTEGAVLGGLVGAALGATVGQQSAACSRAAPPPPAPVASYPQPYYGSGYGYDQPYYNSRPYDGRSYGYNDPYDDGGAYGPAYYPAAQGPTADQCTMAESPIYLPDGRTQKRFVRVCRDSTGHYQVVD
jgi:hypothetical protein